MSKKRELLEGLGSVYLPISSVYLLELRLNPTLCQAAKATRGPWGQQAKLHRLRDPGLFSTTERLDRERQQLLALGKISVLGGALGRCTLVVSEDVKCDSLTSLGGPGGGQIFFVFLHLAIQVVLRYLVDRGVKYLRPVLDDIKSLLRSSRPPRQILLVTLLASDRYSSRDEDRGSLPCPCWARPCCLHYGVPPARQRCVLYHRKW